MPPEHRRKHLERLAYEVMPELRKIEPKKII